MCVDCTACNFTEHLTASIRCWLSRNVPEFTNVIIADSGCFHGLHLGRQAGILSVAAPVQKIANRVQEVVMGRATAATSIIRYNQRGPFVLSYVSQFAQPPSVYNLDS